MKFSVELPVAEPDALMTCALAIEARGLRRVLRHRPSRSRRARGSSTVVTRRSTRSSRCRSRPRRRTRLRLHTNCLIPAYRDPLVTAKSVATLDAASRGRVILGVAVGYLEAEFEALGRAVRRAGRAPRRHAAGDEGRVGRRTARQRRAAAAACNSRTRRSGSAATRRPRCGARSSTATAGARSRRRRARRPRSTPPSIADVGDARARDRALPRAWRPKRGAPIRSTCASRRSRIPAHKDVVDPDAFVDEAHGLARHRRDVARVPSSRAEHRRVLRHGRRVRRRRRRGARHDRTTKIYIHEFIDIIGHNRARYMHHMTANWCPTGARRAQHAVLRRVGNGRLDGAVARGRQHVGARTAGTASSRTSRTSSRRRRCRIRRSRSGGRPRPSCGAAASIASSSPNRGARRSRSSPTRACAAWSTRTRSCTCRSGPCARSSTRWPTSAFPRSEPLELRCVGAFRVAMTNDTEAIVHLGDPVVGGVGALRAGVGRRRTRARGAPGSPRWAPTCGAR